MCCSSAASAAVVNPSSVLVWCRSDVQFQELVGLEENEEFPAAFFAFLLFLFEHRPAELRDSLMSPTQKSNSAK
jgi:hypothetical protein